MKSIRKLKNLKGKTALVRVDFNVPIKNGKILDDFRIKQSLPSLKYLLQKGAKLILISHLGEDGKQSLKPVAEYISKFSKDSKYSKIRFVPGVIGKKIEEVVGGMQNGDVVLLENLRSEKGEMKNDSKFARQLASLGDLYVNEAFSVSHRAHASIVGLPKYLPSYAGLQLEKEIKNLSLVFKRPLARTAKRGGFLFILGGAKFSTKIPLIKKFLKIADTVFVGGALANNFFKEAGMDIGKSLHEPKNFGLKKLMKNKKLILPVDVISCGVKPRNRFVDIGPNSVLMLEELIKKSKFILMNGPLGNYEKGFGKATEKILKAILKSKAKTIIGGGDTVSLLRSAQKNADLTQTDADRLFISTGGGAMLEFLEKGTLPGIEALEHRISKR